MKQITNRYKRNITKNWPKHPKPFEMRLDNKRMLGDTLKNTLKNPKQSLNNSKNQNDQK